MSSVRKIVLTSLFVLCLLIVPQIVKAATLTLTKIGASSTEGQLFSTWTYMGFNPVFEGNATENAQVQIRIAEDTFTATATDTGTWTYTPTTLGQAGTYPIEITSGEDAINFNLIIQDSTTATTTTDTTAETTGSIEYPEVLPQTSTFLTTIMLAFGGMTFIIAGVFLYWKLIPQLLFETTADSEEQ